MAFLQLVSLLLTCTYITGVRTQNTGYDYATNDTRPLSSYKSRPDIQAPFLNMTLNDERFVTPGYIFLTPYQTNQVSIYMYDNSGNLVYSGFGSTGGGVYHDFHVCPINGSDFLCFLDGNPYLGYGRGHGVIMDNKLNYHTSVQSQGGLMPSDQHEFRPVDDGKSALIFIYDSQQYDLSTYDITEGRGWIINNWFQEVRIGTSELLFQWDAISHVNITDSYVKPASTDVSGNGLSAFTAFDWFHINSVDKYPNGDYLVSARHVSTIYRIDATTGDVKWRLGGLSSDFGFEQGLNFSFQHDARVLVANETTNIISLFDNASNNYDQSSLYSSGIVLKLDMSSMRCTILRRFVAPNNIIAPSQGSIQLLSPNTNDWDTANYFLGWGATALVSEYTNNGTMVQQGHFADSGTMSYRAYKHNFTTFPTDAPASYAYAHNTSAPTVLYMSWNGATEAKQWRIYVSNSRSGPFDNVATVPRQGFETIHTLPRYHPGTKVEALDRNGHHLRNSSRSLRTFVPSQALQGSCNALECPLVSTYSAKQAPAPQAPSQTGRARHAVTSTPSTNFAFRLGSGCRGGKGHRLLAGLVMMLGVVAGHS